MLYLGISLLGLLAGVMSGLFGIGGGIVMVPLLTAVFGFSLLSASGSSLAALLLPVSLTAILEYRKKGNLDIRVAAIFAFGIFCGSFFGANFAIYLPITILQTIYGGFLLWVCYRFSGFKLFSKQNPGQKQDNNGNMSHTILKILPWAIFAGVLSGLFGIGGGLVMVPIMVTVLKFNPQTAIATSLAALLPPSGLPGVISYYNAGHVDIIIALILAVGLDIGAYFGAKINLFLSTQNVKRLYAFFLFVMAVNYIISALM